VIFCYLFASALLISLNFSFIFVLSFLALLGLPFASLSQYLSPQLLKISEDLLYCCLLACDALYFVVSLWFDSVVISPDCSVEW
jgi:hypothetical protein